ncbi:MAG: hypothetical protein A2Y15_06815 [Clostridiales bacterium GWF2_36_10]|nr:MAG: hypothetical protein A2Y15_06815 [Clostridiales bacterium GWF2_36_10]HAN20359.1 SOS response-associated peptidase [Clostridiales bacterium]
MCGRYTSNTEDEVIQIRSILAGLTMRLAGEILEESSILNVDSLTGKEIFPSNSAPIITNKGKLTLSKFGFEKWDGSGLIINARSETAGDSRYFSPYNLKSRCIIPASNYFEWKKTPGSYSEKYKIAFGNKSGIFMAGFLDPKVNIESFVILTKPASENISFIHDRMPVLLSQTQLIPWLNGSLDISRLSLLNISDIPFEKAV